MRGDDPARILAELARKLSVKKLLADFPSLTPEKLREILKDASKAAARDEEPLPEKPRVRERHGGPEFWTINVDGASRGNPGPAGAGAVLKKGDKRIELKKPLGIATNNVAEYEALIMALEGAYSRGAERIEVRCDSELMVRQMNGAYKVKATHLKPLFNKAVKLAKLFKEVKIVHVERSKNKEADKLANIAIDVGEDH